MACMNKALDEVVSEPSLRESLRFSFGNLADWMRNDSDNPHDRRP
jgi:hemoglobin